MGSPCWMAPAGSLMLRSVGAVPMRLPKEVVAQRGGYPDLLPFLVSPQGSLMSGHAGAPSRAKKTQKRGWPESASSWVETFVILPPNPHTFFFYVNHF